MRNHNLLSENYDLETTVDALKEQIMALAHALEDAGIPFIVYAQYKGWANPADVENSGVGAAVSFGYGHGKESGYIHDLMIDLAEAHSLDQVEATLKRGLRSVQQLIEGKDFEAHDERRDNPFGGMGGIGDLLAALMGMMGEPSQEESPFNPRVVDPRAPRLDSGRDKPSSIHVDADDVLDVGEAHEVEEEDEEGDMAKYLAAKAAGAQDATPELCKVCPKRKHCPIAPLILGL